jgi:beta-glucosidase
MNYKDIIKKMTLEEKASMMSGKDFWQSMNIDRLGINSMFLADGPHGIRKQAVAADHLGLNESLKATCYPTAATMANSWNPELGEKMAECLGSEAVSQKVNVLLGPGLNIKRNPLCGRNFEYFSEDPYLAGKMAAAYVRGIQSNGISACLKHFAANNQEERRMVIDTVVDERTLREIYLTAFEIAVKEGKAKTVMSSYNKINGEYANENIHLLRDILRKEWGFEGVVVTDWGGCNDRVKGLIAGNELEMPTTGGETNRDIVNAIKSGQINESLLDECLERLLKLIFETEEVYKKERKPFDIEKHHIMAQKAAEESIVLLKNEGGVLPLKAGTKIAVIGDFARKPRFQGAGSSIVNPTKLDNTLECIGEYSFEFTGYEAGFNRYGKKSSKLIRKALALAKKADTILLYIGLDEATETEGLDRKDMKLPQNQVELIKALKETGKKIVAVLSCGSAVEMDWDENVDAVVHSCLSGQAGAKAVLNIISGKVNPSGKLSESYPIRYEDCPSSSYFPGHEATVEYREGLFIGYRYYDTAGIPVKYPFGFGLSYTKFEYSDLSVTDKGVSFKIKNKGAVSGAEIAQLYIGAKNSEIFRPNKELKGFCKVFLQAGEEKSVTIPFDDKSFRYFNVKTNRYEIEPCNYQIFVGASSADIRLKADYQITGEKTVMPYIKEELPSYYTGKVANVALDEFEKLLGKKAPDSKFVFVKRNRMNIDYNTTVSQLRYSRGWTGRFFAWGIRFAYKFLRAIGKRDIANVLMMGMFHQPMRGLSRMTGGAISWGQLDGMLLMFNGHFFKGMTKFFREGKKAKELKKAEKAKQLNQLKEGKS